MCADFAHFLIHVTYIFNYIINDTPLLMHLLSDILYIYLIYMFCFFMTPFVALKIFILLTIRHIRTQN